MRLVCWFGNQGIDEGLGDGALGHTIAAERETAQNNSTYFYYYDSERYHQPVLPGSFAGYNGHMKNGLYFHPLWLPGNISFLSNTDTGFLYQNTRLLWGYVPLDEILSITTSFGDETRASDSPGKTIGSCILLAQRAFIVGQIDAERKPTDKDPRSYRTLSSFLNALRREHNPY